MIYHCLSLFFFDDTYAFCYLAPSFDALRSSPIWIGFRFDEHKSIHLCIYRDRNKTTHVLNCGLVYFS